MHAFIHSLACKSFVHSFTHCTLRLYSVFWLFLACWLGESRSRQSPPHTCAAHMEKQEQKESGFGAP